MTETDIISQRFAIPITTIDWLTEFGNWIAGVALLGIFVLIAAEVFWRNLLGTSLGFSWDFAAYLMGAAFMLASAGA